MIIKEKKKASVTSRVLLSQCSSGGGIATPFGIVPDSSREPATGAAEAAGLIIGLIYLNYLAHLSAAPLRQRTGKPPSF